MRVEAQYIFETCFSARSPVPTTQNTFVECRVCCFFSNVFVSMFICVCEVHLFCKKLQDFQVSLLHIQLFQVLHLWAPSIRLPNTTIIFHRSQGLAWGFQPTHLQEVQEFEVDDLPPREEALDPWIPDSESNGGRYRKIDLYKGLKYMESWGHFFILTLIHSKVGYIYIYIST